MRPLLRGPRDTGLRLIAIERFAKGLMLAGIGLGIFRLVNENVGELVRRATYELKIDPENTYVRLLLKKAADLGPRTLRHFGWISLLFAADLIAEGVGLWLDQTWALYLVLVATASFIPFEIRACLRRCTRISVGGLLLNIAVVAYLAWYVWRKVRARRAAKAGG